jgi:hypothetical protein
MELQRDGGCFCTQYDRRRFFCGEVHRVWTRRACSQAGRMVAKGRAEVKILAKKFRLRPLVLTFDVRIEFFQDFQPGPLEVHVHVFEDMRGDSVTFAQ